MDGRLHNMKWTTVREWLDDDLIQKVKKNTYILGRNVGSVHRSLESDGNFELADEFKYQLETRIKGNYPPNTYSQTIKIVDNFLKVKLTGRKEEINFFKPILENIQKKLLEHRADPDD
jgi:hypothetical protein